jgi:hypothetical protein
VKTLSDFHAHLRSYVGNDTADQKTAAVCRAASRAIDQLPGMADWHFYRGVMSLSTVAEYGTGTIAYDHTGGAFDRLVTLTGGTFPDWAASGSIVIQGTVYDAATRESATQITLKAASNPGADVAASTGYRLYRAIYPLPEGVRSIDRMHVAQDGSQKTLCERHPREFLRDRGPAASSGVPSYFGFLGDDAGGDVKVAIWPPSDRAYRLDFFAKRRPTTPRIQSAAAGTASVSTGSAAVAGTGTNFSPRHVGCVFRLSETDKPPTDEAGLNPYAVESLVEAYTSTTAITLADAQAETLGRRAYEISGRIDIEPGPMWMLLLRLAERELRTELRMQFVGDEPRNIQTFLNAAREWDATRYSAPKTAMPGVGHGGSRFRTSQAEDMS